MLLYHAVIDASLPKNEWGVKDSAKQFIIGTWEPSILHVILPQFKLHKIGFNANVDPVAHVLTKKRMRRGQTVPFAQALPVTASRFFLRPGISQLHP